MPSPAWKCITGLESQAHFCVLSIWLHEPCSSWPSFNKIVLSPSLHFDLTCFPGYFSVLAAQVTGPGEMRGVLGQSVSVPCQYMEGYQKYRKYWCGGENWGSCSKVVESTGSEDEVRRGRVSLRDNHHLHKFTVTLENLTLEDKGTYWCGINQRGQDPHAPVKVTVFPGEALRALPSCWKAGWLPILTQQPNPLPSKNPLTQPSHLKRLFLLLHFDPNLLTMSERCAKDSWALVGGGGTRKTRDLFLDLP
uniref:Ig-like domain-containing protein n=1 Tax=Crocodylus porosus TaxID=8502 RepID=A0A7M4E2R8_CROPO